MAKPSLDVIFEEPERIFSYMRGRRKPVFHKSNVFFRDLQFAIWRYAEEVLKLKLSLAEAADVTEDFIRWGESAKLLRRVNSEAYLLWDERYRTPETGTKPLINTVIADITVTPTATSLEVEGEPADFAPKEQVADEE